MMLLLGQRLQGIASVVVRDEGDDEWHCGAGDTTVTLHADGYELLRAMFSRRSRRQIRAWNWSPAPSMQIVDAFGFFGPRDDDQPIPRLAP
ncbi:hypothetical protein [Mycolicibacterium pyrenivorans]|uniref:hypothetical protein n=1 Tax=Mycolicibacterium pyrenivorans TaxID=187102 RepID=UPI000A53F7D7|nr:hypothetical protein [Mycolicibacterium pyrenivorans]MCV7152718.1 hypothetical protein [Mycolicibacterium pyrenivorans]